MNTIGGQILIGDPNGLTINGVGSNVSANAVPVSARARSIAVRRMA